MTNIVLPIQINMALTLLPAGFCGIARYTDHAFNHASKTPKKPTRLMQKFESQQQAFRRLREIFASINRSKRVVIDLTLDAEEDRHVRRSKVHKVDKAERADKAESAESVDEERVKPEQEHRRAKRSRV